MLERVALPPEFNLESAVDIGAETNSVYRCKGMQGVSRVRGYLKVSDRGNTALINEAAVLAHLRDGDVPVPGVLASGDGEIPFLFVAELPGTTLLDVIDPRRERYEPTKVLEHLRAFGEMLGVIHSLPIAWPGQLRQRLEHLIGEESVQDVRFRDPVRWLRANEPSSRKLEFVHGDYNTANVLVDGGVVSGVVDWEFAGVGWREFDLAWALRARICFLNSQEERSAILSGYQSTASYDAAQLKWCEVLNYLHFAYWSTSTNVEYESFALARAAALL